MKLPEDDATDLDDRLVDDLADFDDLLHAHDDLPVLVERLRHTQHLLRELGRSGREIAESHDAGDESAVFGDEAESPSNPPGRVGSFRLVRELGRGGAGIVFLAHDERLGRDVALKLPQPAVLLDDAARERFLREARAVANLDHRNIVPVLEAGEDGYLCYIASTYCSGPTLGEWLRSQKEPVPVRMAGRIVACLARAAAHAHAGGVLHRDIKPGNVLLFSDERQTGELDENGSICCQADPDADSGQERLAAFVPKLTDFGLAKVLMEAQPQTQTGQMMGTPAYMAPEQADRAGAVGPSADVYSLGVVLYELLTGRPPIQGEGVFETLELARRDDPVPPSRLRAGVPRDLETICLKCLAKSPARRYPNGRALADDLGRFLTGAPIRARRTGAVELVWRWCIRKPLAAGLAATSLALLATLTIGFAIAASLFRDAELRQSTARELAERRLLDSLMARAGEGRLGNEPGRRFASLESIAEASELAGRLKVGPKRRLALRNEAIACLALFDLEQDVEWAAYPRGSDITGIAVDSQVERYAMFLDGAIVVRRLADNQIVARITDLGGSDVPPGFRACLRFSPDGSKLASSGSDAAYESAEVPTRVWDLESGRVLLSQPAEAPWYANDLDFSPDSETCVVGFADGSVRGFDLADGLVLRTYPSESRALTVRCDPTGARIAIARESVVEVINAASGETDVRITPQADVMYLEWRPGGTQLAFAAGQEAFVLDIPSGTTRTVARHGGTHVTSVAWHPDGHVLATSGYDGKTMVSDLRCSRTLLVADGNAVRFSDDGSRLAFGAVGHSVGRWNIARGTECRVLGRFELIHGYVSIGFHSDGRLLAVAMLDGTRLFDVLTGNSLATIPSGQTHLAQFLPAGDQLLTVSRQSVQSWTIDVRPDGQQFLVSVGVPQKVETGIASFGRASMSPDGQALLCETDVPLNSAVVSIATGAARYVNQRAWGLTQSPEGQWLVRTQWHGRTELLDLDDFSHVRSLPGTRARAVFSPNGEWLVIGTGADYWILETTDWNVMRHVERDSSGVGLGAAAFSADGQSLALIDHPESIKLLHVNTWEELATLTPPFSAGISYLCFSPDGRCVAASTTDGHVLVWDLAQIREELGQFELDW